MQNTVRLKAREKMRTLFREKVNQGVNYHIKIISIVGRTMRRTSHEPRDSGICRLFMAERGKKLSKLG